MADSSRKGTKKRGKIRSDIDKCTAHDASSAVTTESPSNESLQESFERELYWCIQRLELSLRTAAPDTKKGQDAIKVLKVLQSSKAPMIKKRQMMRLNFGDYRKKMAEEEKQYASNVKKLRLESVESGTQKKSSTYLKKSSGQTADRSDLAQVQNNFAFNFNISEDDKKNIKMENIEENSSESDQRTGDDTKQTVPFGTSMNYYKMATGGNDFKFTFDIQENTS